MLCRKPTRGSFGSQSAIGAPLVRGEYGVLATQSRVGLPPPRARLSEPPEIVLAARGWDCLTAPGVLGHSQGKPSLAQPREECLRAIQAPTCGRHQPVSSAYRLVALYR